MLLQCGPIDFGTFHAPLPEDRENDGETRTLGGVQSRRRERCRAKKMQNQQNPLFWRHRTPQ